MEFEFEFFIIIAMVLCNAVFAAFEMALASVSLERLQALVDSGRRGAKAALFMKERVERSLALVQLGITLVGSIAAAIGGAGVQDSFVPLLTARYGLSENTAETLAVLVLVIPLSGVTILFGELVPKVFAIRNNEWVCLKLSPAMRFISRMTLPITLSLEWAVNRMVRDQSSHAATPSARQLKEIQATAHDPNPMRPTIGGIMGKALMVHRDDSLAKVLERMVEGKIHVAVVADDEAGVLGVVNLNDIVKILVEEN